MKLVTHHCKKCDGLMTYRQRTCRRTVCDACSPRLAKIRAGLTGHVGRPRLDTHCVRGHRRTKRNTYARPDGTRDCRLCANLKWTARRNRIASQSAFAEPSTKETNHVTHDR